MNLFTLTMNIFWATNISGSIMAAEEMGGDYDTYIMPLVLTTCTPGWQSMT